MPTAVPCSLAAAGTATSGKAPAQWPGVPSPAQRVRGGDRCGGLIDKGQHFDVDRCRAVDGHQGLQECPVPGVVGAQQFVADDGKHPHAVQLSAWSECKPAGAGRRDLLPCCRNS